MITFYPGPSKIYPQVAQYLQDAYAEGILSVNHRSLECMDITRGAIEILHQKLHIPRDYRIYFISSATEAWEIIAQSLTIRQSVHFFNGAFGKKWAEYTEKIVPEVQKITFDLETLPDLATLEPFSDVVCITQNETSNGTQIIDLQPFRQAFPEALIAVDVTSSFGGITLDWVQADLWFASVQKCLGLPAGMGIMIASPKALERALQINDRKFYNSLLFIDENFQQFQTHYTPNVLGIYLLNKVLSNISDISIISERIKQQAIDWYSFFENSPHNTGTVLVKNKTVRSDTVLAIQGTTEEIDNIKNKTKSKGITIGNGYGIWKNITYRIANFPAIEENEIKALQSILKDPK
jgi:phosphoserine aminotransferase